MRSLAAYHRVSPDALLGNALARTAAMVHPETVMFSRSEPSGLDLLVSVLGPPGASKTASLKLGRRLMPIPGSADILHRPVHLLGRGHALRFLPGIPSTRL